MKQTILALALVFGAFSTQMAAQQQIYLQFGEGAHAATSTLWSIDFSDNGSIYATITGTDNSIINMPTFNIGYQLSVGRRLQIGADFSFMKGSGSFNKGGTHSQVLSNGTPVAVNLAGTHDIAVSRTDLILYFNVLKPEWRANLLLGTGLTYSTHLHEHPSHWTVDVSSQGEISFPLKESLQENGKAFGLPLAIQAQLPIGKHFQIVAGAKAGLYGNEDINYMYTAGVGYHW